ncbi:MAG: molybdopterin-binding/glycosyltransferase family 2 protein [Rhodovibrionaceae bacterium]
MIFGPLSLDAAEGAYLAHSLPIKGRTLKKGHRLGAEDVAALRAAGLGEIIAARLEEGDVHEDEAARRLGAALAGSGLEASTARTGRCNLTAKARGLIAVDGERLRAINAVDESITVATLGAFEPVEARQMAATVKIIPLAVREEHLRRCLAAAAGESPVIRIAAFSVRKVGLLQTTLPGTKESLLDKGRESIETRLAALGCPPPEERRCGHTTGAVADAIAELATAGCEILLIAGASAIVDRRDVVPEGIEQAGGRLERFGLPVDPGNLSLTARKGALRILGIPGSFRSPKLSGHDWILQRWIAGLEVREEDFAAMGLGGLLKEVGGRPLPRAAAVEKQLREGEAPRIAAIVLAAGKSSRMGSENKLLAAVAGKAMVTWPVAAARAAGCSEIVVVTGRDREDIEAVLAGEDLRFVHNPAYAEGLASSLKAGIGALSDTADGAAILLGDMPKLRADHLKKLFDAFARQDGAAICVPSYDGRWGNPVLFDRRFFAEIQTLSGDAGARAIVQEHADSVAEIAMPDDAVLLDIDTPEALRALTET